MSDPERNPAAAGALLIASILFCAAVGFGLGSLVGLPGILAALGGLIGLFLGFALVYTRFRDL